MAKYCSEWVQQYYLNTLFLAAMQILLGIVNCCLHGYTLFEIMMHSRDEPPLFAQLGMVWAGLAILTGVFYAWWAVIRTRCNGVMTGILHAINGLLAITTIKLISQIISEEHTECDPCADPRDDACNPICKLNYTVWLGILLGIAIIQLCISVLFYVSCFRYYKSSAKPVRSANQNAAVEEVVPQNTTRLVRSEYSDNSVALPPHKWKRKAMSASI